MFVPRIYRAPNPKWTRAIVRGYPLAVLATNGPATPYASHTPVIFANDAESDNSDDLIGARLMGHLNRANPQWQDLKSGCEALLIFSGPNSYVSPTHYGFEPAAPTWDFATVHLRGKVTPIDDQEKSFDVVLATVHNFEAIFGNAWNPESSLEYFRTILPGVGAYSMDVSSVECMFKFSQEQSHETRKRVSTAFAESGESMQREVAGLIDALSEHRSSSSREGAQESSASIDCPLPFCQR